MPGWCQYGADRRYRRRHLTPPSTPAARHPLSLASCMHVPWEVMTPSRSPAAVLERTQLGQGGASTVAPPPPPPPPPEPPSQTCSRASPKPGPLHAHSLGGAEAFPKPSRGFGVRTSGDRVVPPPPLPPPPAGVGQAPLPLGLHLKKGQLGATWHLRGTHVADRGPEVEMPAQHHCKSPSAQGLDPSCIATHKPVGRWQHLKASTMTIVFVYVSQEPRCQW